MEKQIIKEISKKVIEGIKLEINENECPDQFICEIPTNDEGQIIDVPKKDKWNRQNDLKKQSKRIIIVLESPHKDEYANDNNIAPAKGQPGKNIARYLKEIINNSQIDLSTKTKYNLIVINAIPYQCSMGFDTKLFRTLSFIGLWYNGGKKDFNDRLEELSLSNNDVVINCCTKGAGNYKKVFGKVMSDGFLKKLFGNESINYCQTNKIKDQDGNDIKNLYGLQGIVHLELKKQNSIKLFHCSHPSSWGRKKGKVDVHL